MMMIKSTDFDFEVTKIQTPFFFGTLPSVFIFFFLFFCCCSILLLPPTPCIVFKEK